MKIGFNITDPVSYRVASDLAHQGAIDFVEILLDNFTHLNPEHIAEKLDGLDVGFHIMKSEFIHKDTSDLKEYAAIIKEFSSVLNPLYISDHLARFNIHTQVLPITAEINYETEYSMVVAKVQQWQEMLQTRVLLENFPSRTAGVSCQQASFFADLISETGCGLLFDLSNAVVADLNGGSRLSDWLSLKSYCSHFHVAGYRTMGKEQSERWIIDSHDTGISVETAVFTKSFFQDFSGKSIVIERDANLEIESIAKDIQLIRQSVGPL
ncbi:hypothetical protein AZI86_18430 [Bdellovibrio bacteriovorus]|uniref:DUF692 domain-containing protein n=1 Tax=Bdellovibrio bacteriovorus TaxID=959 RepID=A0A150WFA3_BDEBC|nr:DUF692 family multinuclear iron-containing protein [Bdellovibrio bacteriovorus]KYG61672.1 hypothetical protein AZI86_18430 [Bdellovibrio bacteriovorus]